MGFRRTGQMVSLLKIGSFNFFTYLSDLSSLYLITFDELMLEHEAGMGFCKHVIVSLFFATDLIGHWLAARFSGGYRVSRCGGNDPLAHNRPHSLNCFYAA